MIVLNLLQGEVRLKQLEQGDYLCVVTGVPAPVATKVFSAYQRQQAVAYAMTAAKARMREQETEET